MSKSVGVKVWDLPVRLAHVVLVLAVGVAWWTGEAEGDWFIWHQAAGCVAIVTVLFRLAWGFVGTRTARFADFLAGPGAVLKHLAALLGRRVAPRAGHHALGGWAVIALWSAVLFQAGTGLFANDEIMNAGPFYGWIDPDLSNGLTAWHHLGFNLLLGLVGLHVVAVVAYRLWGRLDLLRPMVTGRRTDLPPAADIGAERPWAALALWLVFAAALGGAIWLAPPVMLMSF